jgi:hypothetical protein
MGWVTFWAIFFQTQLVTLVGMQHTYVESTLNSGNPCHNL